MREGGGECRAHKETDNKQKKNTYNKAVNRHEAVRLAPVFLVVFE